MDCYLKVKKLNQCSKIDNPAKKGDAGFDCFSAVDVLVDPQERVKVPLGIAIEIPTGYVALVNQKSGLAVKLGMDTSGNVIDSSYRGEIHAIVFNNSKKSFWIKKGEKICQLLIHKCYTPEVEFVGELSDTERGSDGFGSTGKI